MLNSRDSKSRGLLVDYFFEFKEAIKITKILKKLLK